MARGVIIRSGDSNCNFLGIKQIDNGDMVVSTVIKDTDSNCVVISTRQGSGIGEHSEDVIHHLRAIIDLLSDGSENGEMVCVLE